MELVMVNDVVISEMRQEDGYVNGTRMCQTVNKKIHDYLRLKTTNEFFESLARSAGNPADLVQHVMTGPNEMRGTWVHPHVAPDLAAWCSPSFRAAVSTLVYRYMRGQVTTEESQEVSRRLGMLPARELPPPDVRVTGLVDSLRWLGIKPDNPRWQQALQDFAGDVMGVNGNRSAIADIPQGPRERWCGVVELAEQMGYSSAVRAEVRVALGHHVSRHHDWSDAADASFQRKKENRLCNGTMRPIWVYLDTPALRELITDFFECGTDDEQ